MTDKKARKLDKLLETHKEARYARKTAAAARAGVKGVQGRGGTLAALASTAGTKAVEAELVALRAERRALKKLHAFAVKTLDRAVDASKAAAGAGERSDAKDKKSGRKSDGRREDVQHNAVETSLPTVASRASKVAGSRKS